VTARSALSAGALLLASCTASLHDAGFVATGFAFPWAERPAPRTGFRAWIAAGRFEFSFEAEDADLVLSREWRGESTLDVEDRVEIFFARDAGLDRYYCIEIDPLGRVHDYSASHYRRFDSTWDCPDLRVSAARTPDGYRVDGSIPLDTLSSLIGKRVGPGATIRTGLFRADFYGRGAGARGEAADNWLSWIRPVSATPDFHVPSAFADLTLPPGPR
jgi:hypothetical protein